MGEHFRRRKKIQEQEFGFGNTGQKKRLLNPDGSFNVVRKGLSFFESFNPYNELLTSSWKRFFLFVLLWYFTINMTFAGIYLIFGIEHLKGIDPAEESGPFWEAFFFSAQTLSTVGYGRISPSGILVNSIAAFEALIGVTSFALITGLVFGRFSKPVGKLMFTENILMSPYKNNQTALMFRLTNRMKSQLVNLSANVSSSLNLVDENGVLARRFFRLKLERDEIVFFPTSWTIVHPIDENSPFYGMTEEEFRASEPELLILIQGYDDSYFANIQVRYSYIEENTVWGGKWRKILQVAEDGSSEIHLNHFNDFDRVEINSLIPDKSIREIAD
ncbi:MAG TPA: ion channel [Flavobacteriales bacterium]|nr:ion channel [Flavobacteriales bacterium]